MLRMLPSIGSMVSWACLLSSNLKFPGGLRVPGECFFHLFGNWDMGFAFFAVVVVNLWSLIDGFCSIVDILKFLGFCFMLGFYLLLPNLELWIVNCSCLVIGTGFLKEEMLQSTIWSYCIAKITSFRLNLICISAHPYVCIKAIWSLHCNESQKRHSSILLLQISNILHCSNKLGKFELDVVVMKTCCVHYVIFVLPFLFLASSSLLAPCFWILMNIVFTILSNFEFFLSLVDWVMVTLGMKVRWWCIFECKLNQSEVWGIHVFLGINIDKVSCFCVLSVPWILEIVNMLHLMGGLLFFQFLACELFGNKC